jgi:hypothetical protein
MAAIAPWIRGSPLLGTGPPADDAPAGLGPEMVLDVGDGLVRADHHQPSARQVSDGVLDQAADAFVVAAGAGRDRPSTSRNTLVTTGLSVVGGQCPDLGR